MPVLLDMKGTATINHPHNPTVALPSRSLHQACLAAKACDDQRGKDTLVLDLTGITPLFDYFVITTGNSRRQLHAIAEEADRVLSEQGSSRLSQEGYESSIWIVQDFGDIVVHAFTPEARDLYDLEHLWGDAPHVDWQEVVGAVELSA
jgi:ribosome-associated protein